MPHPPPRHDQLRAQLQWRSDRTKSASARGQRGRLLPLPPPSFPPLVEEVLLLHLLLHCGAPQRRRRCRPNNSSNKVDSNSNKPLTRRRLLQRHLMLLFPPPPLHSPHRPQQQQRLPSFRPPNQRCTRGFRRSPTTRRLLRTFAAAAQTARCPHRLLEAAEGAEAEEEPAVGATAEEEVLGSVRSRPAATHVSPLRLRSSSSSQTPMVAGPPPSLTVG